MATLYGIATKLPCPKIYGADILYTAAYCRSNKKYDYSYVSKSFKQRVSDAVEKLQKDTGKSLSDIANYLYEKYIDPINSDMQRVYEKLKQEGYIDFVEPKALRFIKASKTPKEPLLEYREISSLISEGKYEKAIDCYYKALNGKYFSELTSELIYLKRLANIPLAGRDLLYFRCPASINELIDTNLPDYVLCIDDVLKKYKKEGHVLPLDIIVEYAPTTEQLIQKTMEEIHSGVDLIGGKFKREFSLITADFFGPQYNSCPQGRLFDKYPD